jgi:ribosome-binding factor A
VASYKRANRVSGEIRGALAEILTHGLKDPRVTPITMTSVRVTDDLRIARINFVPLGGEGDGAKILAGLEAARGYLRRELGRRVRLKYVPELRFHLDEGLSESFRVTEILDQMGSKEVSPASDVEEE